MNNLAKSDIEGHFKVVDGKELTVGEGFRAQTYRAARFSGAMDPLIMVDHYCMKSPTFGAHPHAGLSAVSLLFESSTGKFHNKDSLGNDFDLKPGDLYWLKAGKGAVHDESPREGAEIHGLQVFVNLPQTLRYSSPKSLHVHADTMPIINENGCRLRLALGSRCGRQGERSPALPMTILDGSIQAGATYEHTRQGNESTLIVVIKGELSICLGEASKSLREGQAMSIIFDELGELNHFLMTGRGDKGSHFVLFCGEPLGEDYVHEGPFAMENQSQIDQVKADYAAGKFGAV